MDRIDTLIARIEQAIVNDSNEGVGEINRLGKMRYEQLSDQRRLLETLLEVVIKQQERFRPWAPERQEHVAHNPPARISPVRKTEAANG